MKKGALFILIILSLSNGLVAARSINAAKCKLFDQRCNKCQNSCREQARGCITKCALEPSDPSCKQCLPGLNTCLDSCTKK